MGKRRFFQVRPQKYNFRLSWAISYHLAWISTRLGNQGKKSALKSSWVSETNYQEHGWLVTGNALLWEMVSTSLMSSDQGWTSFRMVLCQMRSYWAQLVIISTSEFAMVDKEREKVMRKYENGLVGFLFLSLSVIVWFWAQEWIECCLKCGWVSTALHLLSALRWLSSDDSSKKLFYWLAMKYHLKMQSSNRRVKKTSLHHHQSGYHHV